MSLGAIERPAAGPGYHCCNERGVDVAEGEGVALDREIVELGYVRLVCA